MGVARRANIKNQQLTAASAFHHVGAAALFHTLHTILEGFLTYG